MAHGHMALFVRANVFCCIWDGKEFEQVYSSNESVFPTMHKSQSDLVACVLLRWSNLL